MRQHYFRAPILLCSGKIRFERRSSPFMNSNNPLTEEPETESDAAFEDWSVILLELHFATSHLANSRQVLGKFSDRSGGSRDNAKDFLK
jgi:hypothetical protein